MSGVLGNTPDMCDARTHALSEEQLGPTRRTVGLAVLAKPCSARLRAGACRTALDHSAELFRQRRKRPPSNASQSLPCTEHGRQLRGPNRRPCALSATTIAFSRVCLVVFATFWGVLDNGLALRILVAITCMLPRRTRHDSRPSFQLFCEERLGN